MDENTWAYLPPFTVIKQAFEFKGGRRNLEAKISYEDLIRVIRSLIRSVPVDDSWYLDTYPDVAEGIKDGRFRSARHHFVDCGYLEGRLPGPLTIDETWYLTEYLDVAAAVRAGAFKSGAHHFIESGYLEGRLPGAL